MSNRFIVLPIDLKEYSASAGYYVTLFHLITRAALQEIRSHRSGSYLSAMAADIAHLAFSTVISNRIRDQCLRTKLSLHILSFRPI